MDKRRLNLIAFVLLTFACIALAVTYAAQGWTTLGIVGVVCLGIAAVASAVQLRSAGTTS